jgi:hypothetical protein
MGRFWKLGVAALVVIAVAVPAVVLARGDGNFSAGDSHQYNTVWSGKQSTNRKQWRKVPVIGGPFFTLDPIVLTVSAQMTQGKARFRVVHQDGGPDGGPEPVTPPGPVLFSSRASNAFTFAVEDNCPRGAVLQWRKVGKHKAVAAKLSSSRLYGGDPCVI